MAIGFKLEDSGNVLILFFAVLRSVRLIKEENEGAGGY